MKQCNTGRTAEHERQYNIKHIIAIGDSATRRHQWWRQTGNTCSPNKWTCRLVLWLRFFPFLLWLSTAFYCPQHCHYSCSVDVLQPESPRCYHTHGYGLGQLSSHNSPRVHCPSAFQAKTGEPIFMNMSDDGLKRGRDVREICHCQFSQANFFSFFFLIEEFKRSKVKIKGNFFYWGVQKVKIKVTFVLGGLKGQRSRSNLHFFIRGFKRSTVHFSAILTEPSYFT